MMSTMGEQTACVCQPYAGADRFYTTSYPTDAIGRQVAGSFTLLDELDGVCRLRCDVCGRLWEAHYLPGGGIYGDWDWRMVKPPGV